MNHESPGNFSAAVLIGAVIFSMCAFVSVIMLGATGQPLRTWWLIALVFSASGAVAARRVPAYPALLAFITALTGSIVTVLGAKYGGHRHSLEAFILVSAFGIPFAVFGGVVFSWLAPKMPSKIVKKLGAQYMLLASTAGIAGFGAGFLFLLVSMFLVSPSLSTIILSLMFSAFVTVGAVIFGLPLGFIQLRISPLSTFWLPIYMLVGATGGVLFPILFFNYRQIEFVRNFDWHYITFYAGIGVVTSIFAWFAGRRSIIRNEQFSS